MIYLVFTVIFAFTFYICILDIIIEVENSRSFLHFIVSSFELCDEAYIVRFSGLSDLGLFLDLQKLLIFEWTSFSFSLAYPELRIGLILLTKFKASLPAQCSFGCSPWIPRHRCPIFLLSIMLSEESDNKLFNYLIVRDAFPSSSLSIDENNTAWQFGLFRLFSLKLLTQHYW